MVRRLTALFLILAVAGCTFNKVIVLLDYHFNKSFIAASLCENRSVRGSCCQGKCFLKKQLQRDENAKSNLPSFKEKSSFLFFWQVACENVFLKAAAPQLRPTYLFKEYYTSRPSIFHPPGI